MTDKPKIKALIRKNTDLFLVVGLHLLFIVDLPFGSLSFIWSFVLQDRWETNKNNDQ